MTKWNNGEVLNFIGQGGKLIVDKDGFPYLWKNGAIIQGIKINRNIVKELGNLIHKLTKDGEPPPENRVTGEGWRVGWMECGFNGYDYDWYVCTQ